MNVLIVDDVPNNRKLLRAQLESEGVFAFEAGDGVEALAELKRNNIDAAISDILMPRMDGYRFCYEVRRSKQFRNLPLIIYTATYVSARDETLSFELGADKFLRKPASSSQILEALSAASKIVTRPKLEPPELQVDVLKKYSERLVAKLEEKSIELTNRNVELEQLTKTLELEVEERKKAEQLLSQQANLLNLAHDAIIVRNFDDTITFWNQGAERLYGWTADEVRGKRGADFLHEETAAFVEVKRVLLERGKWNGELHQVKKDGGKLIVSCRWTLVRGESGEPVSIITINSDVTDQKKFEQQLLRAQRLDSIGTLASGIAHDLNNILSPILMSVPLLRADMPTEAREKLVALVEGCAERGAAIVQQVVTFARGADGERVLIQPICLIKEVAAIIGETFPKSIAMQTSYPEDLYLVAGDPTHLHQVLLNLCVNARDAMPEGGSLSISAENIDLDPYYASMTPGTQPGPHILIKVTDTGIGIPAHVIDKIFDPFFTTKEVGKGTGLGLSTVLGIVKNHGGAVNVGSTPAGTTFRVLLPAAPDMHRPQTGEVELGAPQGRGETILVVDDEAAIRAVAQTLLLKSGYKVLLADDGPAALTIFALQSEDIDLVVTDFEMPLVNGIALARTLRKMDARAQIILSTGRNEIFSRSQIDELGLKGVLTKPYGESALLRLLAEVLHGQRGPKKLKREGLSSATVPYRAIVPAEHPAPVS